MRAVVVDVDGPGNGAIRLKVAVASADVDREPGLEKAGNLVRN